MPAHSSSTGHLLPLAEPRAFASWLRVLFRHDWLILQIDGRAVTISTLKALQAETDSPE
jgi:hypothetical protein